MELVGDAGHNEIKGVSVQRLLQRAKGRYISLNHNSLTSVRILLPYMSLCLFHHGSFV